MISSLPPPPATSPHPKISWLILFLILSVPMISPILSPRLSLSSEFHLISFMNTLGIVHFSPTPPPFPIKSQPGVPAVQSRQGCGGGHQRKPTLEQTRCLAPTSLSPRPICATEKGAEVAGDGGGGSLGVKREEFLEGLRTGRARAEALTSLSWPFFSETECGHA